MKNKYALSKRHNKCRKGRGKEYLLTCVILETLSDAMGGVWVGVKIKTLTHAWFGGGGGVNMRQPVQRSLSLTGREGRKKG